MSTARPAGACLTGAVVAARLAEILGQETDLVQSVYYTALFRFIGCTATAPEAGHAALGDDQGFSLAFLLCDWLDLDALQASLHEHVAKDAPQAERDAAFSQILGLEAAFPEIVQAHCVQAQIFAKRLPLPSTVLPNLSHIYSRWDGRLGDKGGEDIPLGARIATVAHVADLYRHLKGDKAAREEIGSRAGKHLDPTLCVALMSHWDEVTAGLDEGSAFDTFVAAEPGTPVPIKMSHCEPLAQIGADIVDQKTTWSGGHCRRVSALAGQAGQIAGLGGQPLDILRHAALLHDIGKCAVSNRVLEKAEPLTVSERLEFEGYSYQTQFLMSHCAPFTALGPLPSSANERFDGSGFHRRVPVRGLAENILAAANLMDEWLHDAPGRPASSRDQALDRLSDESRAGRIAPQAARAVMEAAGASASVVTAALPFDLTRREAEVLVRLARSESTGRIAEALSISEKTADHHVQSIYSKTGVRGRAAIALFAIEHGLSAD